MYVVAAGSALWLTVLGFFLALCRAAALADQRGQADVEARPIRRGLHPPRRPAAARRTRSGAEIFELAARRAGPSRVLRTR